MKIPIQFALTYPQRECAILPSLDLAEIQALEFYRADTKKFPLVNLARWVLEEGDSFPVALNAANEVAVEAFLQKRIKFSDISTVVVEIVESHKKENVGSIEEIFNVDREARLRTRNLLKQRL